MVDVLLTDMKFAVYNIMAGGFERYNRISKTPERLSLLRQAISKLNANTVGLIDTFRWKDIYGEAQVADLFGYHRAASIALEDSRLMADSSDNGIAAVTSVAGTTFETVRLDNRNCLKITTPTPQGTVSIYVVYLDDIRWKTRAAQISALVKIASRQKTIIMGDMNTIAIQDYGYMSKIGSLFLRLQALHPTLRNFLGEREYWEPLRLLEAAGFVSATHAEHKTFPTKQLEDFPIWVPSSLFRIDYVYHTPDLYLTDVHVPRGGVFDTASDHYPVVFEIN